MVLGVHSDVCSSRRVVPPDCYVVTPTCDTVRTKPPLSFISGHKRRSLFVFSFVDGRAFKPKHKHGAVNRLSSSLDVFIVSNKYQLGGSF